jgi:carboxymethylenebutenolidase
MIHEFWGMRDEIAGKAAALAQQGYVVVAPDTYRGATTSWIPRAIWLSLTTPDARVHADLDTVMAWLQAQPDVDPARIVVMGFCYGGGKALSYSLSPSAAAATLAGTGIFYGTLESDPAVLARLPAPVLGIFGALDTRPAPADVAAFEAGLQQANIEHEITVYEGVGHAFVQSVEQIAADPTQAAAWTQFTEWLARVTAPAAAIGERAP